jgi:L-fucose isomerase-like protein
MNNNTRRLPVGLISVGVPWFDVAAAQKNLDETRAWLQTKWPVVGPTQLVTDTAALESAIEEFLTVGRPEILVLQIGTFPDGEAPLAIAERLRVPIILHSLPEPDIEKEIALNSLCGANLSTFTLTEMGLAHKAIHGSVSDPAVQAEMSAYIQAGLALAAVRRLRLGLVGFRAPGFYPCVFDELLIRRTFGLGLDHISLGEVTLALQSGQRRKAPVEAFPAIGGGSLSAEAVTWIERHYAALSSVLEASGKRLFAIKDWPEIMGLNDPGGIWPALGWLQEEKYLIAPEGDVNAGLTMALLNGLTGDVPFFADISAWDDQASALALWHYGGAPCLARSKEEIRYGSEGREVQFTLKPGRATLARVGLHHGTFRILAIGVEVLDRTVKLRRAGAWVRTLNNPAGEVVHSMLDQGWEHHVVLVYGDAGPALRAVSRFTGLPLTIL